MKKTQGKTTITIGVFGLHRYAGVTHTVMLLAEYLSCWRKKRAAVLELSGHPALEVYERLWYGAVGAQPIIRRKRCTYWKEAEGKALWKQEEFRNDYCILDLGCDLERNAEQLMACRKKIILGSSGILHKQDWKKFAAQPRLQKQLLLEGRDTWTLLLNHGRTGKRVEVPECSENGRNHICAFELGAEELFPLSRKAADLFGKIIK